MTVLSMTTSEDSSPVAPIVSVLARSEARPGDGKPAWSGGPYHSCAYVLHRPPLRSATTHSPITPRGNKQRVPSPVFRCISVIADTLSSPIRSILERPIMSMTTTLAVSSPAVVDFDAGGPPIPAGGNLSHSLGVENPPPNSREAGGPVIAYESAAGVVEIRDPRMFRVGQEAFCHALVEAAVDHGGALLASIDLTTATCRIEFGPRRLDAAELAERVASAIRSAIPTVRRASVSVIEGCPVEAFSAHRGRMKHLAMAGGSLGLTIAGIVLPGLPTLPFLLSTGRHAALASPTVERWFRGHRWFARMLEAETGKTRLAFDGKTIAKWVALAAIFATLILILHPPFPVLLALELGVMALVGCWEWLQPVEAIGLAL